MNLMFSRIALLALPLALAATTLAGCGKSDTGGAAPTAPAGSAVPAMPSPAAAASSTAALPQTPSPTGPADGGTAIGGPVANQEKGGANTGSGAPSAPTGGDAHPATKK